MCVSENLKLILIGMVHLEVLNSCAKNKNATTTGSDPFKKKLKMATLFLYDNNCL
jgi:hypothetical protein